MTLRPRIPPWALRSSMRAWAMAGSSPWLKLVYCLMHVKSMVTMPILIDVAVTPRNDAVSPAGPTDVDEVGVGAAVATVGAAAFFPLLVHAASRAATITTTATTGDRRQRLISPPSHPRHRPGGKL